MYRFWKQTATLTAGLAPAGLEHRLGVRERLRDRLLEDHVDAALDAVHGHRGVLVVRGADVDDVGPKRVEHRAVVGVCGYAVRGGSRRGAFVVDVADADQLGPVEVVEGGQVDGRDVTAADDGRADGCRHESALRASRSATCCSTRAVTSRSSTPSHSSTAATASRTGPWASSVSAAPSTSWTGAP